MFTPAPSCFDNKQNQKEEGVDCGGECEACVTNPKDLIIYWARPFEFSSGHYDMAALIENPNPFYGAKEIKYKISLYESNILVGEREGKTYLNPREKFLIFESGISTGFRKADRAAIVFEEINWKRFDITRPNILVSSKFFENAPNGREKVIFQNKTILPIRNLDAYAVLLDSDGNAFGASATRIERLLSEETKEVFFTWGKPYIPPSSVEVYYRVNLMNI